MWCFGHDFASNLEQSVSTPALTHDSMGLIVPQLAVLLHIVILLVDPSRYCIGVAIARACALSELFRIVVPTPEYDRVNITDATVAMTTTARILAIIPTYGFAIS